MVFSFWFPCKKEFISVTVWVSGVCANDSSLNLTIESPALDISSVTSLLSLYWLLTYCWLLVIVKFVSSRLFNFFRFPLQLFCLVIRISLAVSYFCQSQNECALTSCILRQDLLSVILPGARQTRTSLQSKHFKKPKDSNFSVASLY